MGRDVVDVMWTVFLQILSYKSITSGEDKFMYAIKLYTIILFSMIGHRALCIMIHIFSCGFFLNVVGFKKFVIWYTMKKYEVASDNSCIAEIFLLPK